MCNAMTTIKSWFKEMWHNINMTAEERYLASSRDAIELEQRMQEIDRHWGGEIGTWKKSYMWF
jgi:hypothetical protein